MTLQGASRWGRCQCPPLRVCAIQEPLPPIAAGLQQAVPSGPGGFTCPLVWTLQIATVGSQAAAMRTTPVASEDWHHLPLRRSGRDPQKTGSRPLRLSGTSNSNRYPAAPISVRLHRTCLCQPGSAAQHRQISRLQTVNVMVEMQHLPCLCSLCNFWHLNVFSESKTFIIRHCLWACLQAQGCVV